MIHSVKNWLSFFISSKQNMEITDFGLKTLPFCKMERNNFLLPQPISVMLCVPGAILLHWIPDKETFGEKKENEKKK